MLDCEIPLRDCSKGVSSSKKQQAMRGHQTQKLKANGLRLGKRKASAAATAKAAEAAAASGSRNGATLVGAMPTPESAMLQQSSHLPLSISLRVMQSSESGTQVQF